MWSPGGLGLVRGMDRAWMSAFGLRVVKTGSRNVLQIFEMGFPAHDMHLPAMPTVQWLPRNGNAPLSLTLVQVRWWTMYRQHVMISWRGHLVRLINPNFSAHTNVLLSLVWDIVVCVTEVVKSSYVSYSTCEDNCIRFFSIPTEINH